MFASLFIMAFISGLIWCGDVSIAYFGFQVLLAFMFSVIPDLAPATDVTEPVQRAVAITIGVIAAWMVMSFVFPDDLVEILYARLRKSRDRLKNAMLSVAERFTACGEKGSAPAANFAIEDYNPIFSLLLTIRGHTEISECDAGRVRLFLLDCMKIQRETESISALGKDCAEYVLGIDPGLCRLVLNMLADVLSPENGIPVCDLEKRIGELSERISQFEKTQREKRLMYEKSMDFKVSVAHFLLSLRRMLEYARSMLGVKDEICLIRNLNRIPCGCIVRGC
jgi:hypothetical protein